MSALFGERVSLAQANGPEIELLVYGDERYARYETVDGYSVIYDDVAGLFVYASLEDGAFTATSTPATEPPPERAVLHGKESPGARRERIAARERRRERSGSRQQPPPTGSDT